MSNVNHIQGLVYGTFYVARWTTKIATITRILGAIIGMLSGVVGWLSLELGLLFLALLAVLTFFLDLYADHQKNLGNSMLDHLELNLGLGRPVSGQAFLRFRADASELVRRLASRRRDQKPYYGTSREASPRRLVEMVCESAWWTARIAGSAASRLLATALSIGIVALLVVIASSLGLVSAPWPAEWAVAVLTALFAGGPLRDGLAFRRLHVDADKLYEVAHRLGTRSQRPSELEAIELATGYQRMRERAPLLPERIWSRKRTRLSRLWEAEAALRGAGDSAGAALEDKWQGA